MKMVLNLLNGKGKAKMTNLLGSLLMFFNVWLRLVWKGLILPGKREIHFTGAQGVNLRCMCTRIDIDWTDSKRYLSLSIKKRKSHKNFNVFKKVYPVAIKSI
jgi:hypothetical protein